MLLENIKLRFQNRQPVAVRVKKISRFLGVLLMMLAVPTGYLAIRAANGSVSAQTLLSDPMSIFSERSPGARGAVTFNKKPAYARVSPSTTAFEEFSPENGNPPYEGFLSSPSSVISEPPLDLPPLFGELPLGELPQLTGGLPGPGFPGGPIGTIIPPLGIGAPPTPPGPGPDPGPGPGPSVPEPGTWLMLIAGFLAIGSALRLKNRRLSREGENNRKASLPQGCSVLMT